MFKGFIFETFNYLCVKHFNIRDMKKILLLILAITAIVVGCDKKEHPLKLRHDATILIKPGTQTRAHISGKTALEIVQETANMRVSTHRYGNHVYEEVLTGSYGFAERQRDFDTPALKMLPDDIISQYGELVLEFIDSFDIFLTDNNNDTIGYIPNQVMIDAKTAILDAYDREDYDEVYRQFENAYKFYPMPEK